MFANKRAFIAFLCFFSPACGSSSAAPPNGGDSGQSGYCTNDPSAKAFHVGMSDTGGNGYVFQLMEATPTLPTQDVTVGNSWTIKVTNASGPVIGGTFTAECTMVMPGGAIPHGCTGGPPTVKELGNGEYQVPRILFNMPGHWTVKFSIDDSGTTDSGTLATCIEQ